MALPFGPPYKPVVKATGRTPSGAASLSMAVIGSTGESCTNLVVDGRRPDSPDFTITGPDGEEVEVGKFKYG